MSRAPVVDHVYRLQAADLGRQSVRVQILSVSLQGLEESRPRLHLAEFPNRPLVLEGDQRAALIRLTGSALFRDWVGQTVCLQVASDQRTIELQPPEELTGPVKQPAERTRWRIRSFQWRTPLLIMIVLVVLVAIYFLENSNIF